ncbi:MAG TPA: DUF58 domain-containing protein [Nocardioidaceae bacterium]|nr:DUF58 domain-containing protein [Nocardioidaceae bacterium]
MRPTWRPTTGLLRAALGSLSLTAVAVAVGRLDLLVLASPLLVCAAVAVRHRPGTEPRGDSRLLHASLREGEGTAVRVTLREAADVEHAVAALTPRRFLAFKPPTGVAGTTAPSAAGTITVDLPLATLRWGRRQVGDGLVAATSPWAGFRWGPAGLYSELLTTLPLPGRFDTRAPTPHPIGLVGTNPARRTGDGTDFASIRPFAPGDRLRRVHWRVSLRTGALHVTSTHSEEDSNILMVVDSVADLGDPEGTTGTSLDVSVRAAGAVAEHYLARGDRVGLRVLGATRHNVVPMGAGTRHLRRMLDTLAFISPGSNRQADARMQFGLTEGTVVVVLSPMLSEESSTATLMLADRGVSVIVVDTLPDDVDLGDDDPRLRLAWRMRRLERDALLRKVQKAGVPVVSWRGPGTLDEVLRRLGRRASMPRLARR